MWYDVSVYADIYVHNINDINTMNEKVCITLIYVYGNWDIHVVP